MIAENIADLSIDKLVAIKLKGNASDVVRTNMSMTSRILCK
jgi:hypothetical protein